MLSDTNWPAEEVGQFNIPPCLIPLPLRSGMPYTDQPACVFER